MDLTSNKAYWSKLSSTDTTFYRTIFNFGETDNEEVVNVDYDEAKPFLLKGRKYKVTFHAPDLSVVDGEGKSTKPINPDTPDVGITLCYSKDVDFATQRVLENGSIVDCSKLGQLFNVTDLGDVKCVGYEVFFRARKQGNKNF